MGDQEKRQRSAAKGRFTRSLNLFNAEIESEEIDINDLELTFHDVENAWKNVEEKHDKYIAALDAEIQNEEDWIIQIQTLYKNARKKYLTMKNKTSNDKIIKTQYRIREAEYNNFTKSCDNVKLSISNNLSKEFLEKERESVNHQFNKLKEVHTNYSIISLEDDDKTNIDWMNNVSEILTSINSTIDKHVVKVDEINSKRNIRLQKIPLPKFEGSVRNFPRFKRDFVNLVQPTLSSNEAAFGLRQCLSTNVEACLGSCDDNVDDMLKILDRKFGDPCKITDAVVSEIRNFKPINSDQKQIIVQFINSIEKGFIDLKHIDMEKEISNANVVSIIENKLPQNIAERWYRKMYEEQSMIDRKNKFPSLLSFLKIERDALEYGMSELRNSTSKNSSSFNLTDGNVYDNIDKQSCNLTDGTVYDKKCLIHNVSDHTTSDCNTYNKKSLNEKFYILRKNRACFCCLLPGHSINN